MFFQDYKIKDDRHSAANQHNVAELKLIICMVTSKMEYFELYVPSYLLAKYVATTFLKYVLNTVICLKIRKCNNLLKHALIH